MPITLSIPPIALWRGDSLHAIPDVHQFVDFGERALENDGSGSLCRDVAVLTERDAYGGSHHRWSVIQAIADEQRVLTAGFFFHDREFLLRALTEVDVPDANHTSQVAHF